MRQAIPGLIFLLIISVLFFSVYQKNTKEAGSNLVGQEVPTIYAEPIEGLPKIPGKAVVFKYQYVLVNFFASWCTPCLAEHQYLNQLAKDYDLKIIGVAWRDSAKNISKMLSTHGNPYNYVGIDTLDTSAYAFGVAALPESFLVAPNGKVIVTHRGPLVPDVIREKLLPHLQQTP